MNKLPVPKLKRIQHWASNMMIGPSISDPARVATDDYLAELAAKYQRDSPKFIKGEYMTTDGQFAVLHISDGWILGQRPEEGGVMLAGVGQVGENGFLERHGIANTHFPTRRAALEALAVALHCEGRL